MILREFLPGLIGAELTAELLEHGPRLYRVDGEPYIPFEFADAAYRYGHAQIRDRYQVNAHFGPCPVFPDLMGFGPVAPEHTVDWALQIDVEGHPPAQRAKRIDARLPAPLIALPTQISGCGAGDRLRVAGQPRPAARPGRRARVRAKPSRAASACRS